MSKPRQPPRSPRRRRSSPAHPQPPRNRLAEIQAEIQEVQQQIDHSRQARRLIRNAAELTVLEQEITRLTDRLAKLLIAETLQQTADDQEINQQAAPDLRERASRSRTKASAMSRSERRVDR